MQALIIIVLGIPLTMGFGIVGTIVSFLRVECLPCG